MTSTIVPGRHLYDDRNVADWTESPVEVQRCTHSSLEPDRNICFNMIDVSNVDSTWRFELDRLRRAESHAHNFVTLSFQNLKKRLQLIVPYSSSDQMVMVNIVSIEMRGL